MPSFSYSIDEGLAFVPKLKHLRDVSIFSFPLEDNDVLTQRIYDFVNNNPSIEEVTWKGSGVLPTRVPRLPTVRRMLNMSHTHILACILSLDGNSRMLGLGLELDTITLSISPMEEPDFRDWSWRARRHRSRHSLRRKLPLLV